MSTSTLSPPFTHFANLKEIYRFNFPDSDIVIVSFGVQAHFPLLTPFNREKLPHSPDKQLTSFFDSFSYAAPEVIKNTGYRESR